MERKAEAHARISVCIRDPTLFKFLKDIVLPSNDRYPVPSTTHAPLSDENTTCWSRRCVAEETFGQPSISLAVCYFTLAEDIGYNYTTLLAATQREIVAHCKDKMTPAQLMALMAKLPLCRKTSYTSLGKRALISRPSSASIVSARTDKREPVREGSISPAVLPNMYGGEEPLPALVDVAEESVSARRFPQPPPASSHLHSPSQRYAVRGKGSENEAMLKRLLASKASRDRAAWPLSPALIHESTESHRHQLEAASQVVYGGRGGGGVEERINDVQAAMELFYSSASRAFTFYSSRLRELLVTLGVAVKRLRNDQTLSPRKKIKSQKEVLLSDRLSGRSRRGLSLATPTVYVPAPPPPVLEEDLVVTFSSFVKLMDLAYFTPIERRHAQEVWSYEVVDRCMNAPSATKKIGSKKGAPATVGDHAESGGNISSPYRRCRKPPFAKYGSEKYLAWLSQSFLLYEDFTAMLDEHSCRFLKVAFAMFAADGGLYWIKLNFPSVAVARGAPKSSGSAAVSVVLRPDAGPHNSTPTRPTDGQSSGGRAPPFRIMHDEITLLSAGPPQIPTRLQVAMRMFLEKKVEVLTFEDFVSEMHDDVVSLVAFLGSALMATPSKRSLYDLSALGAEGVGSQSRSPRLFGIQRTGKGASGAN